MKPIDEKVDVNFMQALRCVTHRLPQRYNLRRTGYAFALGLRYGLIGAATSHHLLTQCEAAEEHDVLGLVHHWPAMVEEHVRWAVIPRLPFQPSAAFPSLVGRLAYRPLQAYLALYRRLCPLEQALQIASDIYIQDHPSAAYEGWPWWARAKAMRRFREAGEDSVRFAKLFYERRQSDLEEVAEIAVLGE